MADFLPRPEALAAHVPADAGIHHRGRRRAHARDRREHRDLFGRQQRAPQAAAVSGSGSPGRCSSTRRRTGRARAASVPKFNVWRQQTSVVPGRRRVPVRRHEPDRRGQPGAAAVRPGDRRFLPPVRRADRSRPHVHRRRGPAERRQGRRPQLRVLAAALRRRSAAGRQDASRSAANRTSSSASWRRRSTARSSIRSPTCGRRFRWIPPAPIRRTTSPRRRG